MPRRQYTLSSLLQAAQRPEPDTIPWEGPVQHVPERREIPDSWLEKGFDIVAGALGVPGLGRTPAYNLGELVSASLPIVGGVVQGARLGTRAVKRLKTLKDITQEAVPKPIRAYHGSPHDFDEFKLEKIGTGEGAQAYGHGLYFAENPEVAGQYKLSNKSALTNPTGQIPASVLSELKSLGYLGFDSPGQALNAIRQNPLNWKKTWDIRPDDVTSELEKYVTQFPHGRMYEVDIHADPNDFLDWDAPLSQQSEKVQSAILKTRNLNIRPVKLRDGQYSVTKVQPGGWGDVEPGIWGRTPEEAINNWHTDFQSRKGDQLVRETDATPELSSVTLKQAGIPGIKYFDQGSRAAGQGTRNYVVFDEKLISIVKKYGVVGALGAGLISQVQAQQLQEQGYQ